MWAQTLAYLGTLVVVIGAFAMWIRSLVGQVSRRFEAELNTINVNVENLKERVTEGNDNLLKQLDLRVDHLDTKIDHVHEEVRILGKNLP